MDILTGKLTYLQCVFRACWVHFHTWKSQSPPSGSQAAWRSWHYWEYRRVLAVLDGDTSSSSGSWWCCLCDLEGASRSPSNCSQTVHALQALENLLQTSICLVDSRVELVHALSVPDTVVVEAHHVRRHQLPVTSCTHTGPSTMWFLCLWISCRRMLESRRLDGYLSRIIRSQRKSNTLFVYVALTDREDTLSVCLDVQFETIYYSLLLVSERLANSELSSS